MKEILQPFRLFDDTMKFYTSVLDDMENARQYIYIETYRVGNDPIGIRFKDVLAKKAKQGVKIKLLIDSWGGSDVSESFFSELIQNGGAVRFFEKIKLNFDIFTRGHKRNHRKVIIIDDEISYIGSSNITEYNLNWRELVLRIEGNIAITFKKLFWEDYSIYNKYLFDKSRNAYTVRHKNFEILRDVPSITIQRTKKRYIQLIKKAKKSIVIETPYFLPGFLLRKALMDAAKRGVEVTVIIPKNSDVGLVDILRNRYLGLLHRHKIKFLYYFPHNLHAKTLLIDEEIFSVGSSNFDYRSFRYMYEITLLGKQKQITDQLREHIRLTMEQTQKFNYENWQKRPLINKFVEWLLLPIRHLL